MPEAEKQPRQRLNAADVWRPTVSGDITSEDAHSYELYANSAASRGINEYTVRKIKGKKSRVVDVGMSTGATITGLIDGKKLAKGFQAVGVDIDLTGLEQAKAKLKDYNGVNYSTNIQAVQGSGEQIPVSDGWANLVTCLNTMHLFDNPQSFFNEAHRTLGPDGELNTNSTYEKNKTYADTKSKRAVMLMLLAGREFAKSQGYEANPPVDPARFNEDEWKKMAEDAGFVDVQTEIKTVHMTQKDVEAIFSSEEFTLGALPGVPYEVAKEGLVKAVKPTMERFQLASIDRNWLVLTAKKPELAAT